MAAPISRASAAQAEAEPQIKNDPGFLQRWTLGADGKFDIIPGNLSDYSPGGVTSAAGNALVDGLKTIFTSEFMKRLAAAIAGIAIILIVLAKFAGEQAGVV